MRSRASIYACLTHLRSDSGPTPSSLAAAMIDLPAKR
jgi:hypothetical protein